MKVNEQFEKVKKEYVISWEDLREKFGIKEEIEGMYFAGEAVRLMTKWKKTDKGKVS